MIYQALSQKQRKKFGSQSSVLCQYNVVLDQAGMVDTQQKENFAKEVIKHAVGRSIPIQTDETLISELIETDLGYSIPPQLYSLMAEVMSILEEMEENT